MTARPTAPLRNRPHPVRPPIPRRSAPRRRCGARAPTENRNPFAMPGAQRRCSPQGVDKPKLATSAGSGVMTWNPSMTPRVRASNRVDLGRSATGSGDGRGFTGNCYPTRVTALARPSLSRDQMRLSTAATANSLLKRVAGSYHRAVSELGWQDRGTNHLSLWLPFRAISQRNVTTCNETAIVPVRPSTTTTMASPIFGPGSIASLGPDRWRPEWTWPPQIAVPVCI
jgi:hypothetical protein